MIKKRVPSFFIYASFMMVIVLFAIVCHLFNTKKQKQTTVENPTCSQTQNHIMDIDCQQFLIIPGFDLTFGTSDDVSFEVFCEAVQSSGITTLDLPCVMKASTCADIERCLHVVND